MSIKVIISGGVGNQLFQYAFGRYLALRSNAQLFLEVGSFNFDFYYQRKFILNNFKIYSKVSLTNNIFISKLAWKIAKYKQINSILVQTSLKLFFPNIIVEKNINQYYQIIDNSIVTSNYFKELPWIFCGYWQNEGYFNEIREILLSEIQVKKISHYNHILEKSILNTENSVMVHIRLNHEISSIDDEQINTSNDNNENVLPISYYLKAIDIIVEKIKSPKFFIFSDNPKKLEKYKEIFLNYNAVFLKNDRGEDYEDVHLMSKCKNHIISNSSFSWWGAWLCRHKYPIIIGPKNAKYLPSLPSNWIAI